MRKRRRLLSFIFNNLVFFFSTSLNFFRDSSVRDEISADFRYPPDALGGGRGVPRFELDRNREFRSRYDELRTTKDRNKITICYKLLCLRFKTRQPVQSAKNSARRC